MSLPALTATERDVLIAAAAGRTALVTGILTRRSEDAVRWHRRRVCGKLGARNMTHAVAIAFREGLLS